MSDAQKLVGDTSHLHGNTIEFSAVTVLRGAEGHGHFPLKDCTGLKHLLLHPASVRIVGNLRCLVEGPHSGDKATSAKVALVPSNLSSYPSSSAGIQTVPSVLTFSHSVYQQTQYQSLAFTNGVDHQLKPEPLTRRLPEVVYWYEVIGGDSASEVLVTVSGTILLEGHDFVPAW